MSRQRAAEPARADSVSLPPVRRPRTRSARGAWLDIARLPPAQKRAHWERVKATDPALAALLAEPELAALRAAFGAQSLLIPNPDHTPPAQPARIEPASAPLPEHLARVLASLPAGDWRAPDRLRASTHDLLALERRGRIRGRLNFDSVLEFRL